MNYLSTRGQCAPMSIDHALLAGLAPDGGLFVPERLPPMDLMSPRLGLVSEPASLSLPSMAEALLTPFFAGSRIQHRLPELCARALSIPLALRPLDANFSLLELYLGPTAAFKDFAARFLAEAMAALRDTDPSSSQSEQTVLVATSGDTGAAVAAAFHQRPGFRVLVLFPDGRISPRQAHHLGSFGGNVRALAVAGSFDDCQALAKRAFADGELRSRCALASANSISLGRLLPQMSYYAWLALHARTAGKPAPNVVIPTGNLGNALAAILARRLGFPLGQIVFACNANRTLPDFLAGADYQPQATIATLANAMDVGAPSNAERLRWWFSDVELRHSMQGFAVSDDDIRGEIAHTWRQFGLPICPHTACGMHVARRLHADHGSTWVVAATAHPAKFPEVVQPLVDAPLVPPASLQAMLGAPSQADRIDASYQALVAKL